jgi:sialidase-1
MTQMRTITVAEATPERPRQDGASIVELNDGSLMIIWMEHFLAPTSGKEHAGGDDHAPCHIASMISRDGGHTWTDYRIFIENNPDDVNIHFPCLLRLQNGQIMLYYQRRHEIAPGQPQVSTSYLSWSSDECKTFSEPIEHTLIRRNNMGGNKPIQLSSGRIVLPIDRMIGNWCETDDHGKVLDHSTVSCCYSDDDGRTWTESQTWLDLPLRGCMEARIAELRDGRLLMTMRTQLGSVFKSESSDQGKTWSKPQTTGLRAPESMPVLKRIPQTGDLVIIWNNSEYDPKAVTHWGKRTPLTVAISRDEGETWQCIKNIETDPDYEFTNPTCYFTSQGTVIITYVASKMREDGRFGRTCMPLKAVVAGIEWLYQ